MVERKKYMFKKKQKNQNLFQKGPNIFRSSCEIWKKKLQAVYFQGMAY